MKKQSTKFKVLSILLIIVSVFGFSRFVTAEGNEGKIELTKTATKVSSRFDKTNLKEGRFADVTLNVKANSYKNQDTVYSKLDIVLVLDSSGSMSYGPDGEYDQTTPNRIESAKAAGKQFINTMMDKDGNVLIGLVDFSSEVNRTQSLTADKDQALAFLEKDYVAGGGTNLQSGIVEANEILKKGRADVKKLVIILTDGIPTYYNYTDGWGSKMVCGAGNEDAAGPAWLLPNGGGRSCPSGHNAIIPSGAAKTALDALKAAYTNADVYTITLGNESAAASTLKKINPERTTTPKYKNVTALNYEELAKEFQTIAEFTKDVVAKNAKVTDVIPKEFELTAESITALEEKGIKVTKNKTTGETTLEWTIGDLQGNKDNSLTYTVKANDDYHGSIYTNTEATLSAKIDKDNPYPEYKDQTNLNLTFDKPTVEIPAVIKDDHYNDKKHDSYNGYENTTINGVESILTNDLLDEIRADVASNATKVEVVDEVIINTDTNVVKIANNTYTISKDGVLQGTLTMHDDGTFTFDPKDGITGEVSFTYYVKTTINEYQEISAVKSNVATVTLNIIPSPKTSISGEKIWDDAHNQDGLRPQAITVRLFNDKEEVASKRVTGVNDKWPYEFTNLPKYETGHENDENYLINYTIQEDPVESYEPKIDGFNIVNKHTPKLINISVTKIWNDDNNNDGKRPESITLKLYKGEGTAKTEVTTVTLTSTAATTDSATWTYEFTDLPEKENGNKIIYTVTEDEVTDYTGKVTGNMETGFTITNTHTNVTKDLTIEKIWQDSNNNDRKRPKSITVRLYKLVGQDKIEVKNTAAKLTSANATSENNWSYTYSNLPKYENGEEITYIVEEDELDSSLGYTPEYDYDNYKIFNIYRTEIFSIEGTKTWDDDNNRDGLRPNTIKVTLTGKVGTKEVYKETKTVSAADNWSYKFTDLAKYNAGSIIDYKISEKNVEGYSPTIDNNYNITNTHTPEKVTITGKKVWDDADNQDGKRPESITVILNKTVKGKTTEADRTTVKADENGNWNFTFADLFAKEDGENITYTVDEVTIDGYTKRIKDYTITNTHTPETISYNLSKNWEDYDNNDGIRPEKITVKVYANGEVVKTIEISAANNWTATTGALPKYKDGQEISYSFVEDEVKAYKAGVSQPVVDNDGNVTIVFTNYHELETIDITIEKEWDDAGNKNSRPDSIIVNVFADSEQIETIEITAADNWKYTLEGLQKYQDGKEIEYTIEEIKLDNYVTRYEGYKIINSYKATGEIVPPDTGIKTTSSNSNNLYRELIVLLLGAASITYTFKKKEN